LTFYLYNSKFVIGDTVNGIERFVLNDNINFGYAEYVSDANQTNRSIYLKELINFVKINLLNSNLDKAQKIELFDRSISYVFDFSQSAMQKSTKTKLIIRIQNTVLSSYTEYIALLDSYTGFVNSINENNSNKIKAIINLPLVLMSFATIKQCDYSRRFNNIKY